MLKLWWVARSAVRAGSTFGAQSSRAVGFSRGMQMYSRRAVGALGAALLLSSNAVVAQQLSATADLSGLTAGWNAIDGGGETICSDGSPYQFFVRSGDPAKLLLYFQGGGSCWDGPTCDPDLDPQTYRVNIDGFSPRTARGIFELDREDNPFRDHSVVFAPYCTADVHLGNRVAVYESPTVDGHDGHSVTVNHNGFVNAGAVLDWTYARFFEPDAIFVTGSSAGSIPSPYYAMLVAERYPAANIAQLGDGSSGYRRERMRVTPERQWGTLEWMRRQPEFEGLNIGDLTFERLYIAAASRHPDILFAAFDHAEDRVQKRFLQLAGSPPGPLLGLIRANQADIRESVSNFRSYIAGGELHTILGRPEFYTQHVNGIRVRDWVAALAEYRAVDDVICSSCEVGEFLSGR